MHKKIKFNINKLLDATGSRRRKSLGYEIFCKNKSQYDSMEIDVVRNESAEFINLFGVFVDLKTGNIALGLFPRPDEYICCGNIKNILSKVWFGTRDMPKTIDIKYILQLLKIDPIYYQDEIIQDIFSSLDSSKDGLHEKSICSALVKKIRASYNQRKVLEHFRELTKGDDFIPETIRAVAEIMYRYERIAIGYYGNFTTEQYFSDIEFHHGKTLRECLTSPKPRLETMTVRYLMMGIPEIFLSSLKSYGFSIKDRKNLLNRGKSFTDGKVLQPYSKSEICSIGVALSSMFYVRNSINKEMNLAYNFMDIVRAVDWEQNVVFSIDVIRIFKNKTPWEKLMKKFHIYDILKEQNLSEKEFFLGVHSYIQSVLIRIDWGTCYNRLATQDQYRMVSYAPTQLINAGRVFEMTMNTIKQNLK